MAAGARTANPPLSRFILPILGLVALGLCVGGILVLIDPNGGQNLLATIYDALGNSSGATDLRNGEGDQLIAKIILAVIAIAVGVGGIWLLYLGVGGLVGMLRPVWRDRILPWVFVGPALVLLATYLLYPAAATFARSFFDCQGSVHARQLHRDDESRDGRDPAQQRHLADRGHRRQRDPRARDRRPVRSHPPGIAGQDVHLPAPGHLADRRIRHLGVHVRLGAGGPAADRAPERHRGRAWAGSRSRSSRPVR